MRTVFYIVAGLAAVVVAYVVWRRLARDDAGTVGVALSPSLVEDGGGSGSGTVVKLPPSQKAPVVTWRPVGAGQLVAFRTRTETLPVKRPARPGRIGTPVDRGRPAVVVRDYDPIEQVSTARLIPGAPLGRRP